MQQIKNKKRLDVPSLSEMLLGFLTCSKKYKRFLRLQKHGDRRAERDQDFVYVLKRLKRNSRVMTCILDHKQIEMNKEASRRVIYDDNRDVTD